MLLLLKYPVPCPDWKIYIYIYFFYHYFSSWKMHGVQYFSAGFMRYIKYSVFSCRYTPWITNDPTSTDSEKKKELQPMRSLCNLTSYISSKFARKNSYQQQIKINSNIWQTTLHHSPFYEKYISYKCKKSSRKEKRNNKSPRQVSKIYKASKIRWRKEKKDDISNYERNRSLNREGVECGSWSFGSLSRKYFHLNNVAQINCKPSKARTWCFPKL